MVSRREIWTLVCKNHSYQEALSNFADKTAIVSYDLCSVDNCPYIMFKRLFSGHGL